MAEPCPGVTSTDQGIKTAAPRGRRGHYALVKVATLYHRRVEFSPEIFADAEEAPEMRIAELKPLRRRSSADGHSILPPTACGRHMSVSSPARPHSHLLTPPHTSSHLLTPPHTSWGSITSIHAHISVRTEEAGGGGATSTCDCCRASRSALSCA
eukprot:468201-Prorocentrum_minimum.AAC.1